MVLGELDRIPVKNYTAVSGFCRSAKSGGGTCIYVNNNLISTSLGLENMSEEQHCEVSGILLKKFDVQVITVYHSPNGSFDRFLEVLSRILGKLNSSQPIIVTGDFNVHFNEKDARALSLCNLFRAFNLKKTVKFNKRLNKLMS